MGASSDWATELDGLGVGGGSGRLGRTNRDKGDLRLGGTSANKGDMELDGTSSDWRF